MTIKPLRPHSKTAEILLALVRQAGATFDALAHVRAAARYGTDYRRVLRAKERSIAHRDLARLQERKLLRTRKDGDMLRYTLTAKGQIEALRIAVLRSDLFEDGRMTMVVFDIPESQRNVRRSLRTFLSTAGFAPLQRSVWISPFNAVQALDALFRQMRTRKWIRVFVATEFAYSIK